MATVGLRNLVYCKLIEDTETTVSYDTEIKKLAGAIDAKIAPSTDTNTLYADDGASETATSLGEIEVELETSGIANEVLADVLGHKVDNNGVLVKKATDVAPYLAVGFKSLKSNDKYKYTWLYKGKFTLPENEYHTKEDKIEFKTETISGSFVKRVNDDAWQASVDEDDPGATTAVIDNWFSSVYEETNL